MYSLELDLASRLGVSTAAVYARLCDLCREKSKRDADCHDGLFWVRIPSKDFRRVFPFLSPTTVSRALRMLRNEGLVRVGHYGGADVHDGRSNLSNWYAAT